MVQLPVDTKLKIRPTHILHLRIGQKNSRLADLIC